MMKNEMYVNKILWMSFINQNGIKLLDLLNYQFWERKSYINIIKALHFLESIVLGI